MLNAPQQERANGPTVCAEAGIGCNETRVLRYRDRHLVTRGKGGGAVPSVLPRSCWFSCICFPATKPSPSVPAAPRGTFSTPHGSHVDTLEAAKGSHPPVGRRSGARAFFYDTRFYDFRSLGVWSGHTELAFRNVVRVPVLWYLYLQTGRIEIVPRACHLGSGLRIVCETRNLKRS